MMADAPTVALDAANPVDRLADLFDSQHQRIYRLARRLTRDPEEARDLLQETFLRAARHAHKLPDSRPAAEAWLVRTTVNLCRDLGRRRAVRDRDRHKLEPPAPFGPNPETATVARASVDTALAALSPRRRAVIVLVELEEHSTPEAARLLGIPEGTVRWHLSLGKKELKRRLADELASQETT